MYLISIYFDEKADKQLHRLMHQIAEKTGNTFMTDNQIPPHITIAAMETREEEVAIKAIEACVKKLHQGELRFVSAGAFLPQVIYAEPVLNAYLHEMSVALNETVKTLPDTKISPYYRPFGWQPHCTLGKQLSKEQMRDAFEVLQNHFAPLSATVVSIGIAKPNPHRDLALWNLPN